MSFTFKSIERFFTTRQIERELAAAYLKIKQLEFSNAELVLEVQQLKNRIKHLETPQKSVEEIGRELNR